MVHQLEGMAERVDDFHPRRATVVSEATLSALEADTLRLAAIVESSDDAIISKRLDGTITSWNRAAERLFGYRPEEIIGRSILTLIPLDRQDEEGRIIERLRQGQHVEHFETVRRHKSGDLVDISLSVSPLRLSDGTVIGASKIARDITQKKRAEALLAQQAEHLAVLNRVARIISQDLDLDRIVQAVTDEATAISGARFGAFFYNVRNGEGESYQLYALSGAPRESFDKLGMPRNTAIFGPTFAGTTIVRSDDIRADPRYGRNAPHRGMPEGHLPVASYLAVPVVSGSGVVIGGLFFGHEEPGRFAPVTETLIAAIASQAAVAIDNARLHNAAQAEIAQRQRAQEAKDLLLHEIKHRVKNTLATIQALASQTLKETPPEEKAAFISRLHALAEAHDLLTRNDWETIGVGALVEQALSPFTGANAERIVMTGPDVGISANKALVLTMVLYELGTNAVKYGALSNREGKVEFRWDLENEAGNPILGFTWRESGGPPVKPPQQGGFGTRMITRALQGTEGSAEFAFAPGGLEVCLKLRL